MEELELGSATIVYEGPDGETTEETVDNEQLVYVRDHWAINAGSDDRGNDLMKQIPRDRVIRVERNVEQFEEQARTVRHRVESLAKGVQRKIPMDIGNGERKSDLGATSEREERGREIPVEGGPGTSDRSAGTSEGEDEEVTTIGREESGRDDEDDETDRDWDADD